MWELKLKCRIWNNHNSFEDMARKSQINPITITTHLSTEITKQVNKTSYNSSSRHNIVVSEVQVVCRFDCSLHNFVLLSKFYICLLCESWNWNAEFEITIIVLKICSTFSNTERHKSLSISICDWSFLTSVHYRNFHCLFISLFPLVNAEAKVILSASSITI